MPLDFSQDGAMGAGEASTNSFNTDTASSVSAPTTTPGGTPAVKDAQVANPAALWGDTIMTGGSPAPAPKTPNANPRAGLTAAQIAANPTLGTSTDWMGPAFQTNNQDNTRMMGVTSMFEDGGMVGDDQGVDGEANSGLGQHLALALTSVDAALAYGRKAHGLPTGDEGDQAAAMPMIPGNQSETPGPYKPQPKVAAAMPMIPGNQSETPGPYKPQPKVADNSDVIPDDEETA